MESQHRLVNEPLKTLVTCRGATPSPNTHRTWSFGWFKAIPPGVPTEGCISVEDKTLLYVGYVE